MEEYLQPIFSEAIEAVAPEFSGAIQFETPQNPDHGDLSSNIAMLLAKELKRAPRIVANEIVEKLRKDSVVIEGVEIAGVAANGKIALAKIPQVAPDIITLDMEMPEMDGLTTLVEAPRVR